ncbi:MAG: hypothetical protein P4L22_01145 [Candidatus Babeliales bacterium]|nr:hypothetical protein [Candidatus Babeliales bacterium]
MKKLKMLFLTMLTIYSSNIFASQPAPIVDISEKKCAESVMKIVLIMGKKANKAAEYRQIVENICEQHQNNLTKLYHKCFVTLIKAANEATKIVNMSSGFLIFTLLMQHMENVTNTVNPTPTQYTVSKATEKLRGIIDATILEIASSINKKSKYESILLAETEVALNSITNNESEIEANKIFQQMHESTINQLIKVAKEHQEITSVLAGATVFETLHRQIKAAQEKIVSQNNSSAKFKPFSGTTHKLNE